MRLACIESYGCIQRRASILEHVACEMNTTTAIIPCAKLLVLTDGTGHSQEFSLGSYFNGLIFCFIKNPLSEAITERTERSSANNVHRVNMIPLEKGKIFFYKVCSAKGAR